MAILAMLFTALAAWPAAAAKVGERHLVAHEASAVIRNASHKDDLRITVWYPAAPDAVEAPLDVGPPGKPLFTSGSAALDAPFRGRPPAPGDPAVARLRRLGADHGMVRNGSGAAWLCRDRGRPSGQQRARPDDRRRRRPLWERPGDLATALDRVKSDPSIGPHLDLDRLGAAGFSAGGFTTLVEAGARVDFDRFLRFCDAHPDDGICAPQKEFQFSLSDAEAFFAEPAGASELAHAKDDHSIAGVRAAFVMAPGIVQSLDPESLKRMRLPVAILLGDADKVAPPATNGEVAAALIPAPD